MRLPPRRDFLRILPAWMLAPCAARWLPRDEIPHAGSVMTVLGPIPPERMGVTLPHEHIVLDFIGADQIQPGRAKREEIIPAVLPHLVALRKLGCQTLVECTPDFIGREPQILQALSKTTGLNILTNTGLYNAANGKFLPAFARVESSQQLAQRWIREAREGIGSTGIFPGFIKIGIEGRSLSPESRKLIEAAALTHRATGLTIAAHTIGIGAATEQIQVLRDFKVHPSAWIWVHANTVPEDDWNIHLELARQGAWIEFDNIGVGAASLPQHRRLLLHLKSHGLLDHALISHDAGWFDVNQPGGGAFRPFDTLFTKFLPDLRAAGFTDAEIDQLTILNPRNAFTIRSRLAPA
jgi:phosphotriesterase-related protein